MTKTYTHKSCSGFNFKSVSVCLPVCATPKRNKLEGGNCMCDPCMKIVTRNKLSLCVCVHDKHTHTQPEC